MKPEITLEDVVHSCNLFEKLAYGQGKAAAATVAVAVLRQYTNEQLKPSRETKYFTSEEIRYMKDGNKLHARRLVRQRLNMTLEESKNYVEKHGIEFLMESGKWDENAHYITDHQRDF